MTAALTARDVHVKIGEKSIVEHASVELTDGRLVAVVGPNGAGKSTLVRAISGIQPMAAGWL
jgi:ABC-type Mn2+/Zn2+ transport system ATPase subunit